jgi:hypothetical protein
MGSIENRLKRLEDSSREGAVEDLKRAWAALTDEELALVLCPYVEKRSDRSEAEELIGRAIGLTRACLTNARVFLC